MGKRRKEPKRLLTLEEQLAEMPEYPLASGPYDADLDGPLGTRRVQWADRKRDLIDRIKARDTKRNKLVDPGRNASGHFDVSPFAARGHLVEVAPKDLGEELPKDLTTKPRRIATSHMIDRYLHGHKISHREWRAGKVLLEAWCGSDLNARVTAAYDPVSVRTTPDPGRRLAAIMDASDEFEALLEGLPYRTKGCVKHVIVLDEPASAWAAGRGKSIRDSERHGLRRLRQGLSALADQMGY